VLDRLGHPQPAVERAQDADQDAEQPAAELLRAAQLVADDGELAQRRVDQPLLQLRVAGEHVAQDRGAQQQQPEQRDERVVGDQRGQVGAGVVDVLVDDGDREARDRVPALQPVQSVGEGHRRSAPRASVVHHADGCPRATGLAGGGSDRER
jgi:hypothetical protein